MSDIAKTIDSIATAFEEYKSTNDARIEAIKAGKGTGDLDAKLARMDNAIDNMSEVKAKLEQMETKLSRPGLENRADGVSKEQVEYKNAFLNWMRAPTDGERQAKAHHRCCLWWLCAA